MKQILTVLTILIFSLFAVSCESERTSDNVNQSYNSPFTVTESEWKNALSLTNISAFTINYTDTVTSDGERCVSSGTYKYELGTFSEKYACLEEKCERYSTAVSLSSIFDADINVEIYAALSNNVSCLRDLGYSIFKFSSVSNAYEYTEKSDIGKTTYSIFFGKNNLVKKISINHKATSGVTENLVCELSGYNEAHADRLPKSQAIRDFNTSKLSLAYTVLCEGFQEPFVDADMSVLLSSISNFLLNFLTIDDVCTYTVEQNAQEYSSVIVATMKNSYVAIAGTTINYNSIIITTKNDSIIELSLNNKSEESTECYDFRFIY